jgi:hypothetical protein
MQRNRQRWMELCERAADEQDPEKLRDVMAEIARLLNEKYQRLRNQPTGPRNESLAELPRSPVSVCVMTQNPEKCTAGTCGPRTELPRKRWAVGLG